LGGWALDPDRGALDGAAMHRWLSIALLALVHSPAAAAPDIDPRPDPLGYLRQALAATCALEDPGAEALARRLGRAEILDRKAFGAAGPAAGWRRRYRLGWGDEIVLIRHAPDGLLRRFAVEYHQRQPDDVVRPVARALAGSDCRIFNGRLMRYDLEGHALDLELLGADLARSDLSEPLNPPVPAGRDPGGVAVALFDSGLNYTLPTFAGRLARDPDGKALGYDFWDLDERPFDNNPAGSPFFPVRHGTAVASVLLEEAPGARFLPYRYPRPEMSRMADMVEAAAAAGARIVAMPMGSNRRKDWAAFAAAARAHPGMLFVISAGNDGRDIDEKPVYPAVLPLDNFLVVTSSDSLGRLAPGSNWGRKSVDLMVPAEKLYAVDFDGAPRRASGSSFAVPRIAALAARLLAANPAWRAPELKAAILAHAAPPPGDGHSPVRHGWIADPAGDE
jgi:hypothetical protein